MFGLEYICTRDDIQYKTLAKQLGVAKQSIKVWIKNKSIPRKHLSKLASMLGVSEEFLTGEVNI